MSIHSNPRSITMATPIAYCDKCSRRTDPAEEMSTYRIKVVDGAMPIFGEQFSVIAIPLAEAEFLSMLKNKGWRIEVICGRTFTFCPTCGEMHK